MEEPGLPISFIGTWFFALLADGLEGRFMRIGETIAELRKDYGLKQRHVALKLNVAVSTISNYETDTHEPDLERLCDIADLYGVSTDYILGRTERPGDKKLLEILENRTGVRYNEKNDMRGGTTMGFCATYGGERSRQGYYKKVAVGCWFTASGRGMPKLIKYEDEDGCIQTIRGIQVVKDEKGYYSGLISHKYWCKGEVDGDVRSFTLLYCPKDNKWDLVF